MSIEKKKKKETKNVKENGMIKEMKTLWSNIWSHK